MIRTETQTKTERKNELLEIIQNQEKTAIRLAEKIASGKEHRDGVPLLDTLIGNEIHSMHRNTLEFLTL